jgi:hypothetical protein
MPPNLAFLLPLVVGDLPHAVFAVNIDNLATAIGLFNNRNNLALQKLRLLHLAPHEAIFTRNFYFSMARFYRKATLLATQTIKQFHDENRKKVRRCFRRFIFVLAGKIIGGYKACCFEIDGQGKRSDTAERFLFFVP